MAEIFEPVVSFLAVDLTGFSFIAEEDKTTGLKRLSLKRNDTGLTVSSSTFRSIKDLRDEHLEFFQLKAEKTFEFDQDHIKAFLRDITRLSINNLQPPTHIEEKESESKLTRQDRSQDLRAAAINEIRTTMESYERYNEKQKRELLPAPIINNIMKYIDFATFEDTGDVLVYRNGVYQIGGETYIAGILEEALGNFLVTKHIVEETIGHIQRKTYISRSAFDKDTKIFNLKNGLLDITTGKVTPHTPEHLSRIQLPVEYKEDAKCPNILKFLCEVMPNNSERLGLLEEAATILIKNTKFQKGFMHIGEGANGKSTWFNVLIALFGSQNISAIPIHDFNKDNKFALSGLDGKIANICADISEEEMEDTSNVKRAITGDMLRVQEKHKPAYDLWPTSKLIFAANKLPTIKDRTKAFLRRWVIHRWTKQFIGQDADHHLIEKLTTPEELSGLLNILVALAVKLQSKPDLTYSPSIEQIEAEWLKNSDLKLTFISTYTQLHPEGYIVKAELIKRYLAWCKQKSYAADSEKTFFQCIRNQYPDKCTIDSQHTLPGGKRVRVIKGMVLTDAGVKLCRLNGERTGCTGFVQHTFSTVLSLEENISAETRASRADEHPECFDACSIGKTCRNGISCPALKDKVCNWSHGCSLLWDGSEVNGDEQGLHLASYFLKTLGEKPA